MCYEDFLPALQTAGFSMGGANPEGIFALIPWDWKEEPPYETPVRWHCGDRETDPWEWRMRILEERRDIAYAKCFFRKSGYITKAWYPYFLAARRGCKTALEEYEAGNLSREAKRIYECLTDPKTAPAGKLPLHELKREGCFAKEEKSAFERGLVELQMKFYITMFGRQQKMSKDGEPYGWSSTVFGTCEQFWGDDLFLQAAEIPRQAAAEKITEQVRSLNPDASPAKIKKFIFG